MAKRVNTTQPRDTTPVPLQASRTVTAAALAVGYRLPATLGIMKDHSDSEIAKELLGYHRMALDRENVLRRQGGEWARDLLTDLMYDDPERCWRIVRSASLEDPDDEALMFFGVTLSGLLCAHPELIQIIARNVDENPKLCEVMSWIMEDEAIEPSVWLQVESLSKPKE